MESNETKPATVYSRVTATLEIDKIGKALIQFQKNCPTIEKNTTGFGYKYADIAQVIETIKPHLEKAGLAYSQPVFDEPDHVGVLTILMHPESGQRITSKLKAKLSENDHKKMTKIQVMGSIITYLRRYSLSSILGIVTDEDIDGATAEPQSRQQPRQQPSKPAEKPAPKPLTAAQLKAALESGAKGITATIKAGKNGQIKITSKDMKKLEAELKKLENEQDND